MRNFIILTAAATVLASPVLAREKQAVTPSGRAEMVFAYAPIDQAVTSIGSKCMDRGWMVTQQTANQVVCEIPMGMWQSALTQMAIGNAYSSPPKSFVRFSLAYVGEHTRVQAQVWSETQMAFGQMRHHQFQDDNTYNNMLGFMGEAGGQFPIGTSFADTAYLGVELESATWQDGRRQQVGRKVAMVYPDSPAAKMGVLVGDVIGKVNNRTFRDDAGLVQLLDRQRIGSNLALTVIRDGQQSVLNGIAVGRPSIRHLIRQSDILPGETGASTQMAAAMWGSPEAALARYKALSEPEGKTAASDPKGKTAAPETPLEKMRREAAEAQARLAAAEAEAEAARATDGADANAETSPGATGGTPG